MAATASLPARSSTSLTTTCAPSAANNSAAARPMPLPAPVISATLPSSLPVILAFQSCSCRAPVGTRSVDHLGLQRVGVAGVRARSLLEDPAVHLVGDGLHALVRGLDEPRVVALGSEIGGVVLPR